VEAYHTVFIVDCSPDLLTPGFRDDPDQKLSMIVESQEEGEVSQLKTEVLGQWLDVGTVVGVIDDGDEVDGDWAWQAYTDNPDDAEK
jgi:pyruvate/2-oxoglutarate dehydrogenase complex dihydrolipoamide acyltransferase (E2) component